MWCQLIYSVIKIKKGRAFEIWCHIKSRKNSIYINSVKERRCLARKTRLLGSSIDSPSVALMNVT